MSESRPVRLWGNLGEASSLLSFSFLIMGIVSLVWFIRTFLRLRHYEELNKPAIRKRHPPILYMSLSILAAYLVLRPASIWFFYSEYISSYTRHYNWFVLSIEFFGQHLILFIRIWLLFFDSMFVIAAQYRVDGWSKTFAGYYHTPWFVCFGRRRGSIGSPLFTTVFAVVYFGLGLAGLIVLDVMVCSPACASAQLVCHCTYREILLAAWFGIPLAVNSVLIFVVYRFLGHCNDELWLRREALLLIVLGWTHLVGIVVVRNFLFPGASSTALKFRLLGELLISSMIVPFVAWITARFGPLSAKYAEGMVTIRTSVLSPSLPYLHLQDVLIDPNMFSAFVRHNMAQYNVEALLFVVELAQFKRQLRDLFSVSKKDDDMSSDLMMDREFGRLKEVTPLTGEMIRYEWLDTGDAVLDTDVHPLQCAQNLFDKYLDGRSELALDVNDVANHVKRRVDVCLKKMRREKVRQERAEKKNRNSKNNQWLFVGRGDVSNSTSLTGSISSLPNLVRTHSDSSVSLSFGNSLRPTLSSGTASSDVSAIAEDHEQDELEMAEVSHPPPRHSNSMESEEDPKLPTEIVIRIPSDKEIQQSKKARIPSVTPITPGDSVDHNLEGSGCCWTFLRYLCCCVCFCVGDVLYSIRHRNSRGPLSPGTLRHVSVASGATIPMSRKIRPHNTHKRLILDLFTLFDEVERHVFAAIKESFVMFQTTDDGLWFRQKLKRRFSRKKSVLNSQTNTEVDFAYRVSFG